MGAELLPLRDIRIADFSWVGAGPFMTKPLADNGADVIKVESRVRTDVVRNMPPFRDGIRGVNRSGYFANRNSSKRSICLDLRTAEGKALALKLVSVSDIVVNNFTPGTMERLGLGYEAARAVRPDVIYLEMPMQGNWGPHSGYRGFGLSIAAAAGFYGLSGYPNHDPVGTGTNYPDHVPNPLHGALALLAALVRRRQTGEGSYIELAQIESTVNIIGPQIVAAAAGATPMRRGNLDTTAAPHGVYRTAGADRWIAIAVTGQIQWARAAEVLQIDEHCRETLFATHSLRLAHRDQLDGAISESASRRNNYELATALTAVGVPAAAVASPDELVNSDPQLLARKHWVTLPHPEMGPSIYDAAPYTFSRTPSSLRSAAPLLGADTKTVCTELLGLTDSDYERLAAAGTVG